MFGYPQKTLPVRYAGGPLLQADRPRGSSSSRARRPIGRR